jgi:hypothetical protein
MLWLMELLMRMLLAQAELQFHADDGPDPNDYREEA